LECFDLFLDADIGIKLGKSELVAHLIGCWFRDARQEEATCILEFVGRTVILAHVGCSGDGQRQRRRKGLRSEQRLSEWGRSIRIPHPQPVFKGERVIGCRKSRV